jgi:outer membrane biosynthesis protein TonB
MNSQDNIINVRAATGTIVIHVLLLLFFLLFRYSTPEVKPVEELGMEVNLGTDENGNGFEQPQSIEDPSKNATQEVATETPVENITATEIEHSEEPEAPKIAPIVANNNKGKEIKPHTQKPDVKSKLKKEKKHNLATNIKPKQKPRYVYHNSNGNGGNKAMNNVAGNNEGNTHGKGDRGLPNGVPGSSNYKGSPGNGTGGISHTLSGRDISPKQFVAEFNEAGKVVVRVKVDRDGNIISKTIRSSSSAKLSEIALQKLAQAHFTKKSDAAPEQIGDVTFVFKTRAQ